MRKRLIIPAVVGVVLGILLAVALQYWARLAAPSFPRATSYLSQIGLASQMYAQQEGGGVLPDSFESMEKVLYNGKDGPLSPEMFFDPHGDNKYREQARAEPFDEFAKHVDEISDFVWIGKGKKITDSDAIIAYEKPTALGSQILVLYPDRRTEYLSFAEARKLIPETDEN